MAYVDGFVLVVPKKNRAAYKKMAKMGKDMWTKKGVLDYKECRLTDANSKYAKLTFPKLAKPKAGEEVWFSYVVYKDKKQRDRIMKEIDKEMGEYQKKSGKKIEMPFDEKRMAYGGFVVEVG